jgi:quinol monooxygenase YgiN
MKRLFLFGLMLLSLELTASTPTDYQLFVTIKVRSGKDRDYKKALVPYLAKVRAETGILTYRVHQSFDEPTLFEIYAHFASAEAHKAHIATPHTQAYLAAVSPLFEEGYPVRRKFFELR